MKVLNLLPFSEYNPANAGYGNATKMMCSVYNMLETSGSIDKVRNTTFQEYLSNEDPEKYDVTILTLNIYSIIYSKNIMQYISYTKERTNKLMLSVVWETSPLPNEWIQVIESPLIDGFVSPSFFVIRNLKALTSKPVYYYPHYIDMSIIEKVDVEKKSSEDTFNVLFVGQNTIRKGLEDGVVAFARALPNVEDASLTIKYHNMDNDNSNTESKIVNLINQNFPGMASRVYTINESLSYEQMISLYHNASVILCPSRGEGFGLPAAEGMACGLPVIYTNWSSLPEICIGGFNYPIDYMIDEAHGMTKYGYSIGLNYAVPKIRSIMTNLTLAYNTWKEHRKDYYISASKNHDIIAERFGISHVAKCVMFALESIISGSTESCSKETSDLLGELANAETNGRDIKSCACKEKSAASPAEPSKAEPDRVCSCSH